MDSFIFAARARADDSGSGGAQDPALEQALNSLLVHQPAALADGHLFMSGGPESTARRDIVSASARLSFSVDFGGC